MQNYGGNFYCFVLLGKEWQRVFLAPIFIACVYLSLKNLDNTYFWDDEAQVAIIARNFLATGELTGWDGRNLLGFRNGALLDKNLHTINPPLEYFLCALSFKLFGISTWSGRVLFVIVGLIALGIFALLVREDFGKEPWLQFYCFAGLAFSPVFLLHIRQCRYYALALLFSLLTFYFYRLAVVKKMIYCFFLLTISAVLFFYTNFLLCVAFLLALSVVYLLFHLKHSTKREWMILMLCGSIFLLATLPYSFIFRIWYRPDLPEPEPIYPWKLKLLWWNVRDLNLYTFMPWIVGLGLIYFLIRYRKKEPVIRTALQWATLALGNIFFISLLSPQSTKFEYTAEMRYQLVSFPWFVGLAGVFFWLMARWRKIVSLILFLISLNTTLLTLIPFNYFFPLTPYPPKFFFLLPAYFVEVHKDYPTSVQAVVEFLEKNAHQDELVYAEPEYFNYSLMFYLGDKLRFSCLLNSQTKLPQEKLASLNAPLFIEQNFPDWFIVFRFRKQDLNLLEFFSRPHERNGKAVKFNYPMIKVLNIYWEQTQRPELYRHSFGPIKNFDVRYAGVYIFKRGNEMLETK